MTRTDSARFAVTKKDLLCGALFVVFWLLPVLYTGLTNKDTPLLPRTLCYLHRISFLFTHAPRVHSSYYIQARAASRDAWATLPEKEYFQLQPFGYRTRLQPLLTAVEQHYAIGYVTGQKRQLARNAELASWVALRFARLHLEAEPIKEVRFVMAVSILGEESITAGHWQNPRLEDVAEDRIMVLSVHDELPRGSSGYPSKQR